MKKHLLAICTVVSAVTAFAQPSPDWTINQQAIFPTAPPTATAKGIRFLDAVDQNVVWTIGYDGNASNRAYNWWSLSTNGGATFTGGNVLPDTLTYVLANLEGIDATTAWVSAYKKVAVGSNPPSSGQGGIFRTTNSGSTWQNMTATGMYTNSNSFCNIVSFFTPSVGITMGDPVNGAFEIWRTTDGGLSWLQIPSSNIPAPNSGEFGIVNLYYKLGSSNLWYGTNDGRMFYTTNAGVTWSVATVAPITTTLTEIAFATPQIGLAYVYNGTSIDVYRTTNGGANWAMITPTGNIGYADIVGIPGTGYFASFGSATGNTYLSYSTDNGDNWIDWNSIGIQYLVGDFVDGSTGWAGSFDYPGAGYTNIWKYTGATLTGTSIPAASFTMPVTLCGPNVSVTTANSTTSNPTPTFSWSSIPAGAIFSSPTATNPTISFTNNTTYTIVLVATNANGTTTSEQVVTVQNCVAPTSSFVVGASACNNVMFPSVNSSSGGSPAPSYSWSAMSSGTGAVTFTPNTVVSNPSIVINAPGTYTINLAATNNLGTANSTQTVVVADCSPVTSFSLNRSLVNHCDVEQRAVLSIQGTTSNPMAAPITYSWSVLPTTGRTISNATGVSPTITINSNATSTLYTVILRATNKSGVTSYTQTVKVKYGTAYCDSVATVGLPSLTSEPAVDVFPNPAHDVVSVSVPGNNGFGVTVTNILGAVIYEEKAVRGESVEIHLGGRPKGVYFVSVQAGDARVTRKIILE
jgi:photosystem II stability/assembly factor-like uncharacterized protein